MSNYLIELIKNNPFIFSIFLLLIAFLIALICKRFISFSSTIYSSIQNCLLIKSNRKNKTIISKLVIILYKAYKKTVFLLIIISPFSFKQHEPSRFEPKLLKTSSKKNVCTVLICLGFSFLISAILNNINLFSKIYHSVFNSNYIDTFLYFIAKNKILLTTLGVLFFAYSVFKDKFTNKIILQIQDEELKNIIVTHKELFKDFIFLREVLCKNIDNFFDTYKKDGIISRLHKEISNKFPDFQYDTEQKSFQRKDTSCSKCYYTLFAKTFHYIKIENIIEKMNSRITEFKNSNSFYNTSTINKYVKGLEGFDITHAIQSNNTQSLLCEEFFLSLCEDFTEHQINTIEDYTVDDESKIKILNDQLNSINSDAISTARHTIEYAIDIEKYICKFSKIFALKTRRKQLTLDQIVVKYK